MKIVVWLSVLTDHQGHTLRALQIKSGETVEIVVAARSLVERNQQGWTMPDQQDLSVSELSDRGWWRQGAAIVAQHLSAFHLFGGLWGDRRFLPLLGHACRVADTGLISEPYADTAVSYFGAKARLADRVKSGIRPLLYRSAGLALGARVAAVFAISDKAAAQFRHSGFNPERIFPFGYFVPADRSPRSGKEHSLSGPLRLAFAGGHIERKGLRVLLDSLGQCRVAGIEFQLDVYGPGEPVVSGGAGIAIRYRGTIPFGQTQKVLRDYDVLIVPSLHDGWGVVVNEALIQGVPVIASDRVGAKILIESSRAGNIFVSGDSGGLAHILMNLARDPALIANWRTATAGLDKRLDPAIAASYMFDCLQYARGIRRDRPQPPWSIAS